MEVAGGNEVRREDTVEISSDNSGPVRSRSEEDYIVKVNDGQRYIGYSGWRGSKDLGELASDDYLAFGALIRCG